MKIQLTYDENTKQLKLEAPLGVSPLLVIALLSQGVTMLAAPMIGSGKDLIVPVQGFQGLKSS